MANRRARCQDKGSVVSSLGVTIDRFPQPEDLSLTGDATSGAFRAHASPDAQARSDRLGRDGEGTSTGADSSAAKPGVPVPPDPLEEPLGRLEFDQETAVPAIEDLFHREPVSTVPLDFDLRRDTGTSAFAVEQAGLRDIPEPVSYTHLTLPTNREV